MTTVQPRARSLMRIVLFLQQAVLALLLAAAPAAACAIRDFTTMPLPRGTAAPWALAMEAAYPGLTVAPDGASLTTPGDATLPTGARAAPRGPRERLADSTIVEQFAQPYPLRFDLDARRAPWFDPGRARSEPLFRALYGNSEGAVRASLTRIRYQGRGQSAAFMVSQNHCAAAQLQAALDAIAANGPEMDIYFDKTGGSFNWRYIAGTQRLSGHSFGMAVDFNTELGGYWRWSNAPEGNVGAYNNRYPESLVSIMERHGYIWGGKWHHFDGMHFEYRPELILYARMIAQNRN